MKKHTTTTALLLAAAALLTGCGDAGRTHPARTGSVIMPKEVGKRGDVAEEDLHRLGFADDRIKLRPEMHLFVGMPSHWVVDEQSVRAGARVDLQAKIVLTVHRMNHPWRHHDY